MSKGGSRQERWKLLLHSFPSQHLSAKAIKDEHIETNKQTNRRLNIINFRTAISKLTKPKELTKSNIKQNYKAIVVRETGIL